MRRFLTILYMTASVSAYVNVVNAQVFNMEKKSDSYSASSTQTKTNTFEKKTESNFSQTSGGSTFKAQNTNTSPALQSNSKAENYSVFETPASASQKTSFETKNFNSVNNEKKDNISVFEEKTGTSANGNSAYPVFPTTQGTQNKQLPRGIIQKKLLKNGTYEQEEKEAIYFYYKDFKIIHMYGGKTACDVKFVLLTKLSEKLSNISFRLKWPNMTTSMSFDDVAPGVRTYYDYRLYGDGCYSMYNLPNVTINRCRLKGKSQQECASLFELLTPTK